MNPNIQPPKRKQDDPVRLQETIADMDAISQDGFSRISALTELLLSTMESPDCFPSMANVAHVLALIRATAFDHENSVNSLAEDMGCNFINDRERRRWAAEEAQLRRLAAQPRFTAVVPEAVHA